MANLRNSNEMHPVQRRSSLPKHTRLREKEKHEVESPPSEFGVRNINSRSSQPVERVSSLRIRHSIPANPAQTERNHVIETPEDLLSHRKLRVSGDVVKRLMTPVLTRSKQNTWSPELTLNKSSPISKNQEFITTIEGTGEHSDGEKEQQSGDTPLDIDLKRKLSFEDSYHVDSLEFEPKQGLKQDEKDPWVKTTFCEHNQEEDDRCETVCETSQNLPINSIINAHQGSYKTDLKSPVDSYKSEIDTRSTYEKPDLNEYNHAANLRDLEPQSRKNFQMNCDNNNMLNSGIPVFKRSVSLPEGLPFCGSLHLGNRHRSEESLFALKIKIDDQAWRKVYTEPNDKVHLGGVVSSTSESQNPKMYCKSNILVQTVNLKKSLNLSSETQGGLSQSFPSAYVAEFSSTPNESPINLTGDVDIPFCLWPTSLKAGKRNNETRSMPDLLQPSIEREHQLVHMSANLSVSMQYRPTDELPDSLNTWSNTETLDSQRNECSFLPNCPSPICSSSLQSLLHPSEPEKAKNEPPASNITLSPSTSEQEEVIETIFASKNPLFQCAPPEYNIKSINSSSTDLRDPELIESVYADISPCISNINLEEEWPIINDSPNAQSSSLPNNQRYSSESSSTDQSSNSDPWEKVESSGESNNQISPDSSPERLAEKADIHRYECEEEPFRRQEKSPVRPKSLDANYIFKPQSDLKTDISRTNRPEPLELYNQHNKGLPKLEIQVHDRSPGIARPKSLDIDRVFSPSHVSNSVTPEKHTIIITPVTPGVSEDDLNITFRRDSNFNLDTLSPRMSLPTIRRKRANQLRKIDDAHRFSLPRNLLRLGTPPADEFEEELPPSKSASLEKLAPEIGDDSCYRIVYELVMTEQSYVSRLYLLNKVFFETIARENEKHRYFSPDVLETIFSNTPQIHSLHKDHLLPLLKKRITEWEKHNKIGDIMRKYAPMFKLYSIYVCEMEDAIEALDKWISKSSKFNNLLKNIQKKKICGRIGLKEHMLEPVQRLPRYQLLLERYLKKLPDNSEDKEDTNKALGIIKEAAQHANDFIKSREMRLRLITIGKMIDGEKIVTPTREIIKEGSISMEGKNGPEQKRLFLFNDMLMVCTPTKKMLSGNENLKVKFKLNVERIKANDYEVDTTGTTFTVRSTTKEGVDSEILKMQCASEDEKYAWLQELREATTEAHERSLSFRRKLEEQKSKSTGEHPKEIFRKMQGKSSNDNNGPVTPIHLTTSGDETEIFV
ncbi:uncharacterized protein LOC117100287 [Anneissia japonica]|uniref:uncharacterized protein LOC117100287 n=1 Tax=Anneissia japonica TaxID=1529436 RepID=UPI0014256725|nr:uncharacterized protein LOC117100287 [Anneissia japonica]